MNNENRKNMDTFAQIPLSTLLERIEKGSSSFNELFDIMKVRQALADALLPYHAKISKTNIYLDEIPGSTSEKAVGFLKNYHLFQNQDAYKYSAHFRDNVIVPMFAVKKANETEVQHLIGTFKTSQNELIVAAENLEKTKKELQVAKESFEKSNAKYIHLNLVAEEALKSQEAKRREIIDQPTKQSFSMGRMLTSTLSAFETNPETDKIKQMEKCRKRYKTLLQKNEEVRHKKKLLTQQYEQNEEIIDMVLFYSILYYSMIFNYLNIYLSE
jgi:hypothetical protein